MSLFLNLDLVCLSHNLLIHQPLEIYFISYFFNWSATFGYQMSFFPAAGLIWQNFSFSKGNLNRAPGFPILPYLPLAVLKGIHQQMAAEPEACFLSPLLT